MSAAPIQHTSASVLEFDSLREMLRAYAPSPLGQARIASLAPAADRGWIAHQQQLTAEVRQYLRAGGRFEFSGLLDPTRLVERARIEGAHLDPGEIRDLHAVVDRAAEWREIALHPPSNMRPPESARDGEAPDTESPWPAVAALSSAIIDFTDFLRFFRGKLLPDGTLDDRASPELARLRREAEKQKRAIQESLRAYLRRLSDEGAAQDDVVTIRGERFVIPVKVEQRRRVHGVVHGMSSSGQTAFIEPLETIEQNNELVRLLEEEQAEVLRILREMTRRIAEVAPAIFAAIDVLAELELQFAKARFAEDYDCVQVELCDEEDLRGDGRPRPSRPGEARLLLHSARHPVLERNLRAQKTSIIPMSLDLDSGHRQLIISGPNTGGKTVALKTAGLLALMAQSGIPVPAARAVLPVFDAVLADIGDYQSIEQNLSTFSAHVTNIDFISRTATGRSLVLLDELGSATDPEEGAALAVAIAGHFRTLVAQPPSAVDCVEPVDCVAAGDSPAGGCFSIISTHHTALKVYAANTEGVLNAAVGFDERTLRPTYELRVGVPGASAGINVAQRLGLNPQIIAAARARLTTQAQDVARFLDRLHGELRAAEQERLGLRQRNQELDRERRHLEKEGLKEQRARVREMEKKLEALLRDFEYQAREAVQGLTERAAAQKLSKEAERRIARLRREFKEQFDSGVVAHRTGADRGDANAQPQLVRHVAEGDTVRLKSLGRAALVRRQVDTDTFEVEAGAMKMRVARADIAEVLARAGATPVEAARARGIHVAVSDEGAAPSELNVIGHNVDEATRAVEKFMDRAFLAGLTRVRIVHGSGMGILRKALRQYLKTHPHVAAVTEPPQNEGRAGATVVELRS